MSKGRGLFSSIFKNIRQTLKSTKYQDGELVGKGTHDDLLRSCPTYAEIVESQLGEGAAA